MPLRRTLPGVAVLAVAAIVPILVYLAGTGVMIHLPMPVHLVVVTAAGVLAGAAAVAMSVVGVRLNDGRAVLLGFAFSVVSLLLLLHALATPGGLEGADGLRPAARGPHRAIRRP